MLHRGRIEERVQVTRVGRYGGQVEGEEAVVKSPRLHIRSWFHEKGRALRFLVVCLAGIFVFAGCQSVKTEPQSGFGSNWDGVWSDYQDQPSPVVVLPRAIGFGEVRYSEVIVDGPYIALTFDDGPNRRLTPELLDILGEYQVRATFFVVGRQVVAHPAILRRIAANGHEIGNHTWDHPALDGLSSEAVREQLERTNSAIRAAVGLTPTLMRPPYGKTNAHLNQWIWNNFGLKVILWSVDSGDWRHRNAELVQWEIVAGTKPGAIILTHDMQASTVAAMPATLAALLAKGFRFVTVSELIALGHESGY